MVTTRQGKVAAQIVKRLVDHGETAYFAGGCVRDRLMGRTPKDYDIATTATPEIIETIFPKCVPVGKKFGVMIVVHHNLPVEVATFRQEGPYRDGRHPSSVRFTSPQEDAERRDFTINGLFYDLLHKQVIDYVGGKQDIRTRQIRAIGDPEERFTEDRLRLLRAIRFAANLGFRVEQNTWKALVRLRSEINSVSRERIRDELVKMFTRPHAGNALLLLSESGLLKEILPEIEAMKGVNQQPDFHPEGDVFRHTQLVMDGLDQPSPVLALGALLHDVGKPSTFSRQEGRIHFYEHAPVGADMARAILTRLHFPNRQIDAIVSCVANHMKFADVKKMRLGKLKQFTGRDTFEEELELHRIDCLASHGKLDLYRFLKRKIKHFQREASKPKCVLNGHDLLAEGIKPGPIMKEILDEIYMLQLEGKIKSRQEAMDWVNQHFRTPKE